MPGHVTPRPFLRILFSLVSSLLLLPIIASAQGRVPVIVEVLFGDARFGGLGAAGLTSVSSSARTSDLVYSQLAAPRVQTLAEKMRNNSSRLGRGRWGECFAMSVWSSIR